MTGSDKADLNRDAIIAEALRLARHDGLVAVTMRKVAEAMQSSPMSLYRHLANRRDLLVGMLDVVATGLELPPRNADPRADVAGVFTAIHDGLRHDPWAVHLIVVERLAGPQILPVIERLYAALLDAGLPPREAAAAYGMLWHYTVGELLDGHHATGAEFHRTMVEDADTEHFPSIGVVTAASSSSPTTDRFTENIGRILDGVLPRMTLPRPAR